MDDPNRFYREINKHKEDTRKPDRLYLFKVSLIVVILFINQVFSDKIFIFSIRVIEQLQKYDFFAISEFLSYKLFFVGILYLFVCPFILDNKAKAFYNLFNGSVAMLVYAILKMLFADWRPNYLSRQLIDTKYHCEPDYGNPSGHSLLSMNMWIILADDIIANIRNRHLRNFIRIFFAGISFSICLSRLYLGAHSVNQIIFGAGTGYLIYIVIDRQQERITNILFSDIFSQKQKSSIWKSPLFLTCVFFNVITAAIFLMRFHREQTPNYFDLIINCTRVKENQVIAFCVRIYTKTSKCNLFFGIAIGLQERKESILLQLNSLKTKNPFTFLWRVFLNVSLILPLGILGSEYMKNPFLLILKQTIVLPILCYFYGKYFKIGYWLDLSKGKHSKIN